MLKHRMDCWEILGIEVTNDKNVIKKRYAELVKKHHPEDDAVMYKKIREAYEIALNEASSNNFFELRFDADDSFVQHTYQMDLIDKLIAFLESKTTDFTWDEFIYCDEFSEKKKNWKFQKQMYEVICEYDITVVQAKKMLEVLYDNNQIDYASLRLILSEHVNENELNMKYIKQYDDEQAVRIQHVLEDWETLYMNHKNVNRYYKWQELFDNDDFKKVKNEPEFLYKLYQFTMEHHNFTKRIYFMMKDEVFNSEKDDYENANIKFAIIHLMANGIKTIDERQVILAAFLFCFVIILLLTFY